MSIPILRLASRVLGDITDAVHHAPHTDPPLKGRQHNAALASIKKDAQLLVNLAGEAAGMVPATGPGHEAMLGEVLEAVQLRSGRLGLAMPTLAGVKDALAALSEMGPLLGKLPDDRGDLLEAMRAQDATCTLHLFAPHARRIDGEPVESHLDYPVPPGVALVAGLVLMVPVAPPATGRRRANVVEVIADGRCTIVRAKLCRPDVVVVAAAKPTTPEPFLKGDEYKDF